MDLSPGIFDEGRTRKGKSIGDNGTERMTGGGRNDGVM